jgi:hypothetical protein
MSPSSWSAAVAGYPCRPALLPSTIPGGGAFGEGRTEAGAAGAGRHHELWPDRERVERGELVSGRARARRRPPARFGLHWPAAEAGQLGEGAGRCREGAGRPGEGAGEAWPAGVGGRAARGRWPTAVWG